jgi:ribonucleoside-diphosphate reductase alpha chain
MFEGIITSQCAEIIEYSDTKKYACCVLASIVLSSYVKEGTFDHQKLSEVVKVVTRNLNKVIEINYYPVEETRTSNMSERPIGIGIQGLADVFFKMGIPYDSDEAIKLDKEIMETIYFSALTASMELSKKDGPYGTFKGSPISKGHFQFDLWKEFPTTKEHTHEISHNGRWDWERLRKDIKKHGVRNSLVTALMPTASTSQIMGSSSEAFEPITSNAFNRRIKAGEYTLLNPYMANDLVKNKLWNKEMRNKLLQSRGSIQNINEIPQNLKDIYKTVWEIKQKNLIDHSIARAQYVDQSQSLNLYFGDGDLKDLLTKAHFYGWKRGLKTGSYYIRSKPAVNAASFTIEEENTSHKGERSEKGDKGDKIIIKSNLFQSKQDTHLEPQSEIPLLGDNNDCEMCGS